MRRWARAIGLVAAVAACSGGDAGDDSTELPEGLATTTAATAPAAVDPGTAVLVLAGVAHRFDVACEPDTTTTTAPGVTTLFDLRGVSDAGATLLVLRQETQGAAVTVTDTVTFVDGPAALEAQRAGFSGVFVDLREDGVTEPLLAVEGTTVRAHGRFGPPGSTAASSQVVGGDLVAACPSS